MKLTMQRSFASAAIATGIFLAACGDDRSGDDEEDGAADDGPDAGAGGILPEPAAGAGFQLGLDVALSPGEENEVCRYFVLPGDGQLDVNAFEHAYSNGSHHLLVYLTGRAAGDVDDQIFPCAGTSFADLGVTGVAYGAQVARGEIGFPDDVALKLRAGDVILVQAHYLNASDRPLDAQVRVNMLTAAEPAAIEAGTFLFYNYAILVPPNEEATARMTCGISEDVNLIYGMSHMHRRGVGYRSWVAGGDLAEPEMLIATDDWENVEPTTFAPEKRLHAGQRVEFECDYVGEPSRTIVEGPSAADNEMCTFVAAYYPRTERSIERCRGPGTGPVFDGETACGEVFTCVQGTADPVVAEACLLDTCPGSADALNVLFDCIYDECQAACSGEATECETCVTTSCGEAVVGCYGATCD